MGEDGRQSLGFQGASLLCPDLVDRLVHIQRNMEAVQDMDRLTGLPGNDFQVRLPHVAADKAQPGRPLPTEGPKEAQQGPDGPVFSHPEQPFAPSVDLIDDREVLVSSLPQDLIHSNGSHIRQVTMGEPPAYDPLHGTEDFFPGGPEDSGDFLPGEPFCPSGQKLHISERQGVFAFGPGNGFYLHAAALAVDPALGIDKKDRDAPERDELELSGFEGVIAGPAAAAARTDRTAVGTRSYLDDECRLPGRLRPLHTRVNKGLELLHPIQNSLQLHPDLRSHNWICAWQSYPIQDRRQDALDQSPQLPSGAVATTLLGSYLTSFSSETERKPSRACGNVGKSRRFLARLFQAAVEIRSFCGFPRTRHFHQVYSFLLGVIPTDFAEDPNLQDLTPSA